MNYSLLTSSVFAMTSLVVVASTYTPTTADEYVYSARVLLDMKDAGIDEASDEYKAELYKTQCLKAAVVDKTTTNSFAKDINLDAFCRSEIRKADKMIADDVAKIKSATPPPELISSIVKNEIKRKDAVARRLALWKSSYDLLQSVLSAKETLKSCDDKLQKRNKASYSPKSQFPNGKGK